MSMTESPLATIAAALRRERERVGVSLTELARRAGVAKSTLSQLEAGQGNPSVETLWALAVALGVPFSRLVETPVPRVRVTRAGEGPVVRSERAEFVSRMLSAGAPLTRSEIWLLELGPGEVRRADPHIPRSVEHLVVGAGRVRTGPADAPVELGPGDYATFPGDLPHLYQGLAAGTWAILVMEHP